MDTLFSSSGRAIESPEDRQAREADFLGTRVEANPSVTDYMKQFWSGFQSAGSMLYATERKLGVPGADEAQRAQDARQAALLHSQTPGGQVMGESPMFVGDNAHPSTFWNHPIKSTLYNLMPQAPLALLSAIPPAAVGAGLVRGGVAAVKAGRAISAVSAITGMGMNVGDVLSGTYQFLDGMSDDELYAQSVDYKRLVDSGVSPKDARRKVEDLVTGHGMVPLAAAIGSVSHVIGATPAIARALVLDGVGKGLIRGAVRTGLEEAAGETFEEGTNALQQQLGTQVVTGAPLDWNAIWQQAATGGFLGLVTGGVSGGVEGVHGTPKDMHTPGERPQPTIDGQEPSVGGPIKVAAGASLKDATTEPKIQPTQPAVPDATQVAGATNAEIVPNLPTKPIPPAYPSNKGGQIVGTMEDTGQQKPPVKDKTRYEKGKKAPTTTAVQPPIGLDPAQVEALAPEMPSLPEQTAPVVQPVPAPPQAVQPPTQPVAPPIPLDQMPAAQRADWEQHIAAQQPQLTPAEISQKFGPEPGPRPEPRILPDLTAQQPTVQMPETVPGRGKPVDLTDVNNPSSHKAWRYKMEQEARGSYDPLMEKKGGWRKESVNVIGDDGSLHSVPNVGALVDEHRTRMASIKQLLDCVNAS